MATMTKKNVCYRCKKRAAVVNKRRCQVCIDKQNDYDKSVVAAREAAKLCVKCGKKSQVAGKKTCKDCRMNESKERAVAVTARKEKGICYKCGVRKAKRGDTRCNQCVAKKQAAVEKQNEKYDANKKKGLCLCGARLHTDSMCKKCFGKRKSKEVSQRNKRAEMIYSDLAMKSATGAVPVGFIYKVDCRVNGKSYIGQTKDFDKRKHLHIYRAVNNKVQTPFANALKKHGEAAFSWKIVRGCFSQKELNHWERRYINQHKTLCTQQGYNVLDGVVS